MALRQARELSRDGIGIPRTDLDVALWDILARVLATAMPVIVIEAIFSRVAVLPAGPLCRGGVTNAQE